tara:strand:+ start:276 stop:704 length:429 start_codon:yes stop_codon:yes gene_type:complete
MKGKQLYDMKSMCNELCSMCHNTKNRVIEKMCECEKDKCVLLGKYMKCLLTMEQLCQYICTCCCEEEAISSNTMAEMKAKCKVLSKLCTDLSKSLTKEQSEYVHCDKMKQHCQKISSFKSSSSTKKTIRTTRRKSSRRTRRK